jgi:ABC-type antimicrobial peptide transport system permease subunit
MTIVIRSNIDPATLTASARRTVQSIDPTLPIAQVRTLEAVFDRSVAVPKLAMICLLSFGVLSLALSAIGVYAVIAYWVARRRSEIGIRIALGARQRDVVSLVVVQGMMPALLGLAVGTAAAWGATRLMEKILFEVSARDTVSFIVALVTLGAIALAATILPARRAASVDPITALRTE